MLSEEKSTSGGDERRKIDKTVIVIVGPTGSGKTNLSLKLAQFIPAEIISADSRQIYKFLDVGTAKPSKDELKKVPHHFIDTLNPSENYDASLFEKDAEKVIEEIFKKKKTPIVVGGSGLYIKALIDGIFDTADKDENYRKKLLEKRKEFGNEFLYEQLKKVDPQSAANMFSQNWKRVMRALEVYHSTGEPIWKHHEKQSSGKEKKYLFKQFGLNWQREDLYNKINQRVDWMNENGLIEEVKSILSRGFNKNLNSLNTVGYKEIIQYLEGKITLERAIALIKQNTRHYAKRQLTWFKKDQRINWLKIDSFRDIEDASVEIYQELKSRK